GVIDTHRVAARFACDLGCACGMRLAGKVVSTWPTAVAPAPAKNDAAKRTATTTRIAASTTMPSICRHGVRCEQQAQHGVGSLKRASDSLLVTFDAPG